MQEKTKEILKNWKYRFFSLNATPKGIYSDRGFHHYECIFFHIPKTGGVSVSHSLFKNLGLGHLTVDLAKEFFTQETLMQYFKFTFVRDPYARLYSSFWFLKNGGFSDKDKKWAEENLADFTDFKAFVMEWLNEENCYSKIHFMPQHHFIIDPATDELFVDFCGRFEQIEEDFNFLCKELNIRKKLIHTNKGKKTAKESFRLNTEVKKKIVECYAKDFELFSYSTLL